MNCYISRTLQDFKQFFSPISQFLLGWSVSIWNRTMRVGERDIERLM